MLSVTNIYRDAKPNPEMASSRAVPKSSTYVILSGDTLIEDLFHMNALASIAEVHLFHVAQVCFILWNNDFTWLYNPGRDAPLMSGGLLALSRRWWEETEGYDTKMVAWGGERLD